MQNNFKSIGHNLLRAFNVRIQHPRVVLDESLIELRKELSEIETQLFAARDADDIPKMENLQKQRLYIESEIDKLEGKKR